MYKFLRYPLKIIMIAVIVVSSFLAMVQMLAAKTPVKSYVWTNFTAKDGSKWQVQKKTGKIRIVPVKKSNTKLLGAGYAPVTGYQTLTTSRVSAAATSIPVASVLDKAGNVILPSNISPSSTVRMYFNFEPGTPREEPFYCTGISSLTLTGCVRGLSFQGGSLTGSSTIAQIHNAGAAVIMTNTGAFYSNEFLATNGGAQTVYGAVTFNNATTTFGSNSSGIVYFPSSGKLGYKNDTGSSFTFDAGSSGLSASTTRGIFVSGSQIGINASTTQALGFDTAGNLITVLAPTTSGLKYSGGGLAIDYSTSNTWTGTQTFTNNVTSTGNFDVTTAPSTVNDVTNKNYVDNAISVFAATSTVGETVAAGQPLYIRAADGKLYRTGSSVTEAIYSFVGIANAAAATNTQVSYTRPGGITYSVSGLSAGNYEYLASATGTLSTTPGSIYAKVGQALSATSMRVIEPKFIASGSFTYNSGTATPLATTIGFRPALVVVRAVLPGAGSGDASISVGDSANTCIETNGSSGGTAYTADGTHAWQLASGAVTGNGIITLTSTGFSSALTANSVTNITVQWTAYSE